jgi:hypothetical protein
MAVIITWRCHHSSGSIPTLTKPAALAPAPARVCVTPSSAQARRMHAVAFARWRLTRSRGGGSPHLVFQHELFVDVHPLDLLGGAAPPVQLLLVRTVHMRKAALGVIPETGHQKCECGGGGGGWGVREHKQPAAMCHRGTDVGKASGAMSLRMKMALKPAATQPIRR